MFFSNLFFPGAMMCFFLWGKAFHGFVNWKCCEIFRNDLKMTKLLWRRVEGILLLMEKILHQMIGSLSHYLHGFSTIPGGCFGILNRPTVVLLTSFRLVVLARFGPGYCKESDGVKLGKCFRAELVKAWDSLWCSPSSGKWRFFQRSWSLKKVGKHPKTYPTTQQVEYLNHDVERWVLLAVQRKKKGA